MDTTRERRSDLTRASILRTPRPPAITDVPAVLSTDPVTTLVYALIHGGLTTSVRSVPPTLRRLVGPPVGENKPPNPRAGSLQRVGTTSSMTRLVPRDCSSREAEPFQKRQRDVEVHHPYFGFRLERHRRCRGEFGRAAAAREPARRRIAPGDWRGQPRTAAKQRRSHPARSV